MELKLLYASDDMKLKVAGRLIASSLISSDNYDIANLLCISQGNGIEVNVKDLHASAPRAKKVPVK